MIDYGTLYSQYWSDPDQSALPGVADPRSIASQLLDACGPGSVLDVGSGMGWLVQTLLTEGVDARGVDVAQSVVEICNSRAPGRFSVASVLDLPFSDASFDTVASIDCLEYLAPEDVPRAVREMSRVSRRTLFVRITRSPENRWRRTICDRDRWERQFLAAGFRKHANYFRVTPLEARENESPRITMVLEKALGELDAAEADHDELRQIGRSSDLYGMRYHAAGKYIRPGDTIVDLAAGVGAGLHVLRHNSLGRRFIGFCRSAEKSTYANAQYGDAGKAVEFRTADPSAALSSLADHSIDHVLAFGVLDDPTITKAAVLAEISRVLNPGGRVIVSVSAQNFTQAQLRDLLSISFLNEVIHEERLNPSSKLWIATAIRDPLADGAIAVPYRETVFPNLHAAAHVSTEYARFYRNPWIVHPMVHVGYRVKSPALLETLAHRLLAISPIDSADYGAALCILAYRLIDDPTAMASGEIEAVAGRIPPYLELQTDNLHVLRWQISLTFAIANLKLRTGDTMAARDFFRRCAQMDPFVFSVHLATKTAESFFWAGWLAVTAGDFADARHWWAAGTAFGSRLIAMPIDDVLVNPADPNIYDHGDGMREFVHAIESLTKCANGLHLLSRQIQGQAVNWIDARKTFRGRAEWLNQELREAQGKVANLTGELLPTRRDLQTRTNELDIARKELVQRTAELDRDRRDLVHRTAELDAVRAELIGRTEELDIARHDLIERTAELDAARRELARLSEELEKARAQAARRGTDLLR